MVKVNVVEQFKVVRFFFICFKVNSMVYYSNSFRGIGDDGVMFQMVDGFGCLFKMVFVDKLLGRFGSKVEEDGEWGGEYLLQCNGDVVGDWVVNRFVDVVDGLDDDGVNGLEYLEYLSGRGMKFYGYNFRVVGRGVGNEDILWYIFEKLSSQEDGQGFFEVEDEDEVVEQYQVGDGGLVVVDGGGQRISEEVVDEGINGIGGLESGLLGVFDDLFFFVVVYG